MNFKRLRNTGASCHEIHISVCILFTLVGRWKVGIGSFIRLNNHNTFEMVGAYARSN
jgi:hypothetical protein